ncbi:MAG: hypothetical protein ACLFWG_07865 [Longimicrobiales bacterium]
MTPADAAAIASVALRASALVDQLQGEVATLRVLVEDGAPLDPEELDTMDLVVARLDGLTRLVYAENASEITEYGNGGAWTDLDRIALAVARLAKEGDPYYG